MIPQPDQFNSFLARIDPYRSYWRSLEFACLAVRVGPEWIQFAGRATLSTEPCGPDLTIQRSVDLDDFRAYAGRLEPEKIYSLITNLNASQVLSGSDDDMVRLAPGGLRPYSWNRPSTWPSSKKGRNRYNWPTALHVMGTGDDRFFSQDFWQDIDTRLRHHSPPYNGFASLCAHLDLDFKQFSTLPYFDVCADLPARFLAGEVDRKGKTLKLGMEYVGTPELLIEWLPEHRANKEAVPVGHPDRPGQFVISFPIPMNATGVEARLLTVGADVDQTSLRVDWENILLRISEFFDPDEAKLTHFLFEEISLRNVNPFELGIARLLGLAGYTVLWFGKGVKDALPDLVAYMRKPLGNEQIIFAECTLKNPAEKFSDFAKRADDLNKCLGLKAGSILPVVFVRNDATTQDRKAASGLGLVLCDGADTRKLQDKIKSDAAADDLFQFLRSLSGLTLTPGGLSGLFV